MKVFLIPHFHYDTEWVMTKEEYAKIASQNIKRLLEIMRKNKDFKFVLDQYLLLEQFSKFYPSLWGELIKRIKEGRIELVCGMYVMPDALLPGVESEIRQILYAKPLFEKVGGEVKVGWMIDAFGQHSQTPQLFKKAGYKYYTFKRGYRGEPTMDFIWKGLDGSEILVHYLLFSYDALWLPEDVELGEKLLLNAIERAKPHAIHGHLMVLTGSDFSKPNPKLPEIVKRAREISGLDIRIATPIEFLREIERFKDELPVVEDEMIFGRYHRVLPGCYSSRINVKQKYREVEFLLQGVETLSTFAYILGKSYPRARLKKAWKLLLENAFHDVICGCGIDEIYESAEKRFKESKSLAFELSERGMKFIAKCVNTRGDGIPLILFNPLPWEREEVAEFSIDLTALDSKGFEIVSHEGEEIPYEALNFELDEEGKITQVRVLGKVKLPPLGYKLFYVKPSNEIKVQEKTEELKIENEFFKVIFKPEMGTIDVYSNGELIIENGNDLEISTDVGDLYYSIEPKGGYKVKLSEALTKPEYLRDIADIKYDIVEMFKSSSELRESIRYTVKAIWREETLFEAKVIVSLYKGMPRIDFKLDIDFNYPHTILRVLFPTKIESEIFYSEIPGGVVKREKVVESKGWVEEHPSTYPVQNWIAYEDNEKGVALINAGLPEHKIENNTIKLTLLRSVDVVSWGNAGPRFYTPKALMIGKHTFRYSLVPYKGSWKENKVHKIAYSFNAPIFVHQTYKHEGSLPKEFSALEINDNLVLTAFKKGERDEDIVVRFFETEGKESNVELNLGFEYLKVEESDLLENPIKEWNFKVKPFEITTLKIKHKKAKS